MPGIDGWGFIEKLREEESLAAIPIVVVSGAADAKKAPNLPLDVSVIAKGEGNDRLLREIGLALAGRRGATILVAEDDADLRGVLTTSLTKSGHRVVAARDGAEALAAIERDHIDVMVLDLVMPNIDGFEVLARLKELRHGESIPVIVVTGTDRSSTEVQALQLGANVFCRSPSTRPHSPRKLQNSLTRRRRGRDVARLTPTRLPTGASASPSASSLSCRARRRSSPRRSRRRARASGRPSPRRAPR